MDNHGAEWDSILQYISDDVLSSPSNLEWPVSEIATGASLNIILEQDPTPFQVLTPPDSEDSMSPFSPGFQDSVPQDDHHPGNAIVSVSTTFHPSAALLHIPTDLIFLSADGVFFYVHTTQVLASSTNHFNQLVPPGTRCLKPEPSPGLVVVLPEIASVFNILLHAVYNISCAHYRPGVDTLIAAVDVMPKYGLPPGRHITPSTALYALILSQAPTQPIAVYALAAAHDLHDLALPVSSHLLSFALHTLTAELTVRIGPVYLRRLYFLHLGRLDALKRLLLPAPYPHPPTRSCDFAEQTKLSRAWRLASAYLAWDARPDLSTSAVESTLLPLADHIPCHVCKQCLVERVRQLIVQWSMVKRSI